MLHNRAINIQVDSGRPLAFDQALRDSLQQSKIFDELSSGDSPRKVGVCGCHDGAGATSIALNLAIMLQERTGEPVTLIEANLRTPALRHLYGISDGATFADLAEGKITKRGDLAMLPGTHVSVITAEATNTPLPLLNQAKPHIQALDSGFHHVILDISPTLAHPDMTMLAPAIDGVLLVLEAEETRWQVAREARKQMESADISLLGAVLNKKPHYIPDWLYRLL
jgi:Mrp family chromosome partitioning ATPase